MKIKPFKNQYFKSFQKIYKRNTIINITKELNSVVDIRIQNILENSLKILVYLSNNLLKNCQLGFQNNNLNIIKISEENQHCQ